MKNNQIKRKLTRAELLKLAFAFSLITWAYLFATEKYSIANHFVFISLFIYEAIKKDYKPQSGKRLY